MHVIGLMDRDVMYSADEATAGDWAMQRRARNQRWKKHISIE
jgi:hypothetical protein